MRRPAEDGTLLPRLNGKVAAITGGARGFGRAAAELFAREGARVVIADMLEDEGTALAKAISADGAEALFVRANVSAAADMERMVTTAEREYGALDILVANAGVLRYASVEELTEEGYSELVDTNLKGVWLSIKYALPAMRRAGGGSITVTSSSGAARISRVGPLYAATKAALITLARSVALSNARDNIRCNVVSPGPAATSIVAGEGLDAAEFTARVLPGIPMGRLTEPRDVANAMLFFASDQSSFCTGAVLAVDGGQSL